jgi:hypothetical protein
MKYEDAMKSIDGAESVGGQLIVNRGGRNVLVGKDLQGNLIVEDNEEAKGIAREIDEKAFEDGEDASRVSEDRSPLSTHPTKATIHGDDPVPYLPDEQQPRPGGITRNAEFNDGVETRDNPQRTQEAQERRDSYQPPEGADPNTARPNTTVDEPREHHKDHHKDDAKDDNHKSSSKK